MIAPGADGLAAALKETLDARALPAVFVTPDRLDGLSLDHDRSLPELDGWPLRGIYVGIGPDHQVAGGYTEGDRAFAQAEITTTLLAAINHPGVTAINRFTPAAWFERGCWSAWRRILREAGVPVARLTFGGVPIDGRRRGRWLPYGATTPTRIPGEKLSRVLGMAITDVASWHGYLCVFRQLVSENAPHSVRLAAEVLSDEGIDFARVWTDTSARVMSVDCWPEVAPGEEAATAVDLMVRRFGDDLHRR